MMKVLMIEDDPADQLLLRRALEEFPMATEICVCETGEAVLDESFDPKPDLIFLDLNLPGIDGHALLQRLRVDDRFSKAVIIVLSTSASPADIDQSYSLGANTYIQKPSSMQALRDAMRCVGEYWTHTATLPQRT